MSNRSIEAMHMKPLSADQKARQKAEKVADQFEGIFVRTMVSSLRQSGSCGGSEGMFGDGPGADTYADWFDENLSGQLSKTTEIGIKHALMQDFERSGEIKKSPKQAAAPDHQQQLQKALAAIDRSALTASKALANGGIDVTH